MRESMLSTRQVLSRVNRFRGKGARNTAVHTTHYTAARTLQVTMGRIQYSNEGTYVVACMVLLLVLFVVGWRPSC